MASIGSRYKKIYIDFRFRGVRCREQTKLEDTPANRKRAKQILDRIEAEILLGTFQYADYFPKSKKVAEFAAMERRVDCQNSRVPTFSEFAEVWFAENEVAWRFSHKDNVRLTLDKYLIPRFGDTPMDQILKEEILELRRQLSRKPRKNGTVGLSPDRINRILGLISQILKEGADRYGFTNPHRGIKPLKVPKTHIDPFSLEEVEKIIDTVRPDFRNYFITRFFTAMRTGEIDGLKWKYVDFERREILVRETWSKGRAEYTKTEGSQREIQMSQPVYDALVRQKQVTGNHDYVFCNSEGKPIDCHNFGNRVWYPLLRFLGLKKRRPYQTRHTAATLWLAAGESPEWIARQMGHTTTVMLFTTYSRYVPNLTRQDGSAMDRLLASRFPTAQITIDHNQSDTD